MEPDKITEATQLAGKLYQAVLSLKPGEFSSGQHVYRMAQTLALAQVTAARSSPGTGSASAR